MTGRKKAIVTGGSTGIGRGIVYCLAEAGYDVAYTYRSNEASARAVLDSLKATVPEGSFYMISADFSEKNAWKTMFRQAEKQLGSVALLVNNAGVTLKDSIFDLDEEQMDCLLNVDFRSYVMLMKEAVTYMAAKGIRGNVINITSTRADRAYPGDAIYGAVKAAINRAVQSIALDVAPYGIRVNNIAPGATKRLTAEEMEAQKDSPHVRKIGYLSERIPLKRYGLPEDMGRAVVFLASENASYITGITLKIDGGLTIPGMPETPEESADGWGAVKKEIIWK